MIGSQYVGILGVVRLLFFIPCCCFLLYCCFALCCPKKENCRVGHRLQKPVAELTSRFVRLLRSPDLHPLGQTLLWVISKTEEVPFLS